MHLLVLRAQHFFPLFFQPLFASVPFSVSVLPPLPKPLDWRVATRSGQTARPFAARGTSPEILCPPTHLHRRRRRLSPHLFSRDSFDVFNHAREKRPGIPRGVTLDDASAFSCASLSRTRRSSPNRTTMTFQLFGRFAAASSRLARRVGLYCAESLLQKKKELLEWRIGPYKKGDKNTRDVETDIKRRWYLLQHNRGYARSLSLRGGLPHRSVGRD